MEIISPTVVTSGNNINRFEVIYDRKKDSVHVMDIMKIINSNRRYLDTILTFDYSNRDFRLGDKLREIGINDYSKYIKYTLTLNGTNFKLSNIKEITKTAGRPYVPGTSIKGAIRTSLTRMLNKQQDYINSLNAVANNRDNEKNPEKKADDRAEDRIFGSPNNSPFRFLRISDTEVKDCSDLELYDVKVMNICNGKVKWYTRNGNIDNVNDATSIYVEAFREGTVLEGQLSYGFFEVFKNVNVAREEIKNINVIEDMVNKIQRDVNSYIDREIEFYSKYRVNELVRFYKDLKNIRLNTNEFIIQIGFSTGYLPKAVVRDIDDQFLIKFKVIFKGKVRDMFPKTRKVTIKNGEIYKPLGWVKIKLIES